MPSRFHLLIAAQFCSALADHALLIVAIARLQQMGLAPWLAPLLKFGFTLAYVVGAPFVGALADAVPKARLMAWMNGVKLLGALLMLGGLNPLLGFALVGVGAAAYAPAKYGLVTETVPARRLVAANGWIEVSVVCAVLLGTVAGGVLVSAWWLQSAAVRALGAAADPLAASLAALLLIYALAGGLNLGIPDSGARYPAAAVHPAALLRRFWRDQRLLWRDTGGGRLSLSVTTLFWGVGATLQFIVLAWAAEALRLPLSQAAALQGVVAVGVVAGAAAAGRWVPLAAARRMLVFGVMLGLLLPLFNAVHGPWQAVPLLVAVGAAGGLLVVPLNALLQHRGCRLMSAGRSIAVQGFNENASVLAMLAGYSALLALGLPLALIITGLGLALAGLVTRLWRRETRAARRRPAA
ncbi:MAG: lysophospholipid transporter LplT [Rubrivivax sp.]